MVPKPSTATAESASSQVAVSTGASPLLGAVFQPIPDMHNIVRSAIYDALHTPSSTPVVQLEAGYIADIEVGLVCTVDAVPLLAQPLHDRVIMMLGMELDEKEKTKT